MAKWYSAAVTAASPLKHDSVPWLRGGTTGRVGSVLGVAVLIADNPSIETRIASLGLESREVRVLWIRWLSDNPWRDRVRINP